MTWKKGSGMTIVREGSGALLENIVGVWWLARPLFGC
jgi:hypothetical protein